jgi:SAM-dependent methyltransferase
MKVNDYDTIADLYDIYVPVTFDIDFFIKETKKVSGEVLELMSGSGRISLPLIQAGIQLTCVDISAKLNAILKNKLHQMGLKADIYRMDICALELQKKFDMIIIPFHSFAHITSPDDQRKALTRIRQHLNPGGTFICTLGNPNVRQKVVNGQLRLLNKYSLPETHGVLLLWVVENKNSDNNQIVDAMQFYEEYDAEGVLSSKRLLEIHFRLSSKDEFEELVKAVGFRVQAFYGDYSYSEFSDDSPFMIWVLET